MMLRDYMLWCGWLDSERVQALPDHLQLFFLKIGHACDGAHRFENDAAILRPALYPRSLHKVSVRQVASNVLRLREAGLLKLYTVGGKGYGEVLNMRQRDLNRRVLYPAESSEPELLDLSVPPRELARAGPVPIQEVNGREMKGSGRARSALTAPARYGATAETDEEWLERLCGEFPEVDVREQLRLAQANRRKVGRDLERGWFSEHWLAKCTKTVNLKAARVGTERPPENWREIVARMYSDTAFVREGRHLDAPFLSLPRDIQRELIREGAKQGRRSA